MTLTKPYVPTAELVMVAGLRALAPGLATSIATTLPDLGKGAWPDDLFVTVHLIPGALADRDVSARHQSIFDLDFWAAKKTDAIRPLWATAAQGLAIIQEALEDQDWGAELQMPTDYRNARIQAIYVDQEPMRMEGDPSGYARYTLTTRCDWIALPAA
jgi:hypothetical protein